MKKVVILTLFIITIACKAQEGNIVPLSTLRYTLTNGTYSKDLDNDMLYYTGTWKGLHNGKCIVIKIIKLAKNKNIWSDGSGYYYKDEMIGFYTVYSGDPELPNTTVIANSMNVGNDLAPLFSVGDGRNNQFKLHYTDSQFCRANGELILERNLNNPNELTYRFHFFRTIIMDDECPYNGAIPIPLPEAVITLNRVN